MNLTTWVMNILGMIALSLITETIVPTGKTSKIIKGVLSFITVLVIATPLGNILNKEITRENFFSSYTTSYNKELSDTIYDKRYDLTRNELYSFIEENGIYNAEITIYAKNIDTFLDIEKIIIYMDKAVIKKEEKNKIDLDELVVNIAKMMSIEKEQIIIL